MKRNIQRSGLPLTRIRRRAVLFTFYSAIALAISASFAAAPAPRAGTTPPRGGATAPRAGAATRPAAPAAPNPAAAEAQFQKAQALFNQQKYPEAQVENEKALALDPANSDALLLRSALKPKLAAAAGTGTGSGSATQSGTSVKPGVLSAQQISMIRLMELNPDERNIRGSVKKETLDDFWNDVIKKDQNLSPSDLTQANHDRFISPNNLASQIFRIRDSANHTYMEKVTINSDPADLIPFKNTINNYVMQNCATSECHGGDKGGNFRLLTPKSAPPNTSNEQILYTNFYILSQYTGKDGGLMIDRGSPDKSLLLQYSLPKTVAKLPHPAGELPTKLSGTSDNRFLGTAEWIKSLAFPKPNYGITFDLPSGNSTPK